ncbi:gametocyte-specific factor 1 [Syngnathoides biaculeatus]|uniref:gametocyte-specific factor 1 n=1 Tax=Syngnathoides biaculeatus TaxID=300417 RepID=UPI002ADE5721|nr:gametocyte-specific factor 1 [Syngnathoides biaculeatus]XP_061702662.1 gametocyte-specific factor 1 [Syngnathoides biaculeatus]XP_061702672.1 gametocyte-specific factor 1 [Syngnathoides biaculeatus]XP_061702681.1 gametocyte-specific factor 1 [Syngnathoides biaculeatus]
MATVRFGSSIGSSPLAHSAQASLIKEADENDDFDPDKLCQCPFDKSHQIRACRLSYHLLKCKKNHPQLAKELKTCPFHACHLVPKHELGHHMETCPNRVRAGTATGTTEEWRKWKVPVNLHSVCTGGMTEDWDKEVDEAATPFIWSKGGLASLDQ